MRMEMMKNLKENQSMLKAQACKAATALLYVRTYRAIEVREGILNSLNEKTLEKNLSTQQRPLNTRSDTSINLI